MTTLEKFQKLSNNYMSLMWTVRMRCTLCNCTTRLELVTILNEALREYLPLSDYSASIKSLCASEQEMEDLIEVLAHGLEIDALAVSQLPPRTDLIPEGTGDWSQGQRGKFYRPAVNV